MTVLGVRPVDSIQVIQLCQEIRSDIETAIKAAPKAEKNVSQKDMEKLDSRAVQTLIPKLKDTHRTLEASRDSVKDLDSEAQTMILDTINFINSFARSYEISIGTQQKTGATVNALFFRIQDLIKSLQTEKNVYEIEETHRSSGEYR